MISYPELRARQSAKVIRALLETDAWKAVIYLSPTEVVRGTRRYYARNGKPDAKRIEVLVSIGRPNFLERKFIAARQFAILTNRRKEGLAFPMQQIQLKFRKYAK